LTRQIDADLARDNAERAKELKVLLLGHAESGKSTLLKQFKLLHGGGISAEERALYATAVRHNTYGAMKALIRAAENLDIQLKSKASRALASDFDAPVCSSFSSEIASSVAQLWKDPGIQRAYARRHEFAAQVSDSAEYLFTNVERFVGTDFVPNDADLLRARVASTGIVSVAATIEGSRYVFVDVAAQRSDKKRWVHYFEDVRSVMFVASLASFDQQVLIDSHKGGDDGEKAQPAATKNALVLAIELFQSVARSTWFPHSSLLLLLNKRDLFKEKLAQGRQLKQALPDYSGGQGEEEALEAVSRAFTASLEKEGKRVTVVSSCALDSTSVREVLVSIRSVLDKQSL